MRSALVTDCALPRVDGVMRLRLLVNLRVEPRAVVPYLPAGFAPLLVDGHALAGVCVIQLQRLRPAWSPVRCGPHSTNVAHRIAVVHDGRTGMWVPRRDSSSVLTRAIGGRVFPGVHGPGAITVDDDDRAIDVSLRTPTGEADLEVSVRIRDDWPTTSMFASTGDAVATLRAASRGWSPTGRDDVLDVVDLESGAWTATPADVNAWHSSFWSQLPVDSWELDTAVVLRDLAHTWVAA